MNEKLLLKNKTFRKQVMACINKHIENIILFTYAQETLILCRQINKDRCIGCQYDDPSQLHHECLTNTDMDIVYYYFDEALKYLDHGNIVRAFEVKVKYLQYTYEELKENQDLFDWDWWTKENETKLEIEQRIKENIDILIAFQ